MSETVRNELPAWRIVDEKTTAHLQRIMEQAKQRNAVPQRQKLLLFSRVILVPLLLLALVCAFIVCAILAVGKGQSEVVTWVLAGHLPFIALLQNNASRSKNLSPLPRRPSPLEGQIETSPVLLCEKGICLRWGGIQQWNDFSGYQFLQSDESTYRIRFWDVESEVKPATRFWRSVALAVPSLVTVASFLVGYIRYGWRMDVVAALCMLLLHVSIGSLFVVPRFLQSEEAVRMSQRPFYQDVLFDSREVTTEEALAFISHYLPLRSGEA